MKVHINYADGRYLNAQAYCSSTATSIGGFDRSISYRRQDIDPTFAVSHSSILSLPRGAGYWLWKPYLILKTLKGLDKDDWLMYTDSGMYFRRNPWEWLGEKEADMGDKKVATFGECGMNKEYCKRDAFVLMGLDEERYTNSSQRTASIFLCKKTDFSISFLETWINYCTDPRILTDLPNTQGKPNYPEFRDHRHDQSVMSLLCIQNGVCLLQDMTQFGNADPFLVHHRNPT